MAYNPTNWQDGVTPVDASNLNKLEQAVSENSDSIANFGYLSQVTFSMSAGTTYRLLWEEGTATSPRCVMLISVRGSNGAAYANLMVNAYGYNTNRTIVTEISKGSLVSYEIETDNYAMTLKCETSSANAACTLFLGTLPSISAVS